MTYWIYPENWTEPPVPPPVVLTPAQRTAAKNLLAGWINAHSDPVPIGEVVKVAQTYVINNYNKHLPVEVIVAIVVEIQTEWGFPPEPVGP